MRNLPASEFGVFSFVLVIVPFCMSLIAALLVLPVNSALGEPLEARARIEAACLKMNLFLTLLAGIAVFGFLTAAHAPMVPALLLAGFGAALTMRWFARCLAFVKGRSGTAIGSDLAYAGTLMAGLGAMLFGHHVTLLLGACLLLAAALAGLLPFGCTVLPRPVRGHRARPAPRLSRHLPRSHALVADRRHPDRNHRQCACLSGDLHFRPGPLRASGGGQILMRPASLVQSALPDLERPRLTRAIAARDDVKLTRMLREFRFALVAVWLATAALAAAILIWEPHLLLKKGYAQSDVLLVTLITAAIMLVRSFRTPPATFMQAAGAFKALVGIGVTTSVISVTLTLGLLLTLGPIASLCGILAGEIVIVLKLNRMMTQWKARHV